MIDSREHFRCRFEATEPIFYAANLRTKSVIFFFAKNAFLPSHNGAYYYSTIQNVPEFGNKSCNLEAYTNEIRIEQPTKPILSRSCPAGIHTAEVV